MTRARAHKSMTEQISGPATAMTNLDFAAAVWTAFNLPIPTGHAWRRPALPGLKRWITNHRANRSPDPGIGAVLAADEVFTVPPASRLGNTRDVPPPTERIADSTPPDVQSPNGPPMRTFVSVRRGNDGPTLAPSEGSAEQTSPAADEDVDLFDRSERIAALDFDAPEPAEVAGRDSLAESGAASAQAVEPAHSKRARKQIALIIGERMRKARIHSGYTIEQASELLGYGGNKTQLSLIENGERSPSMKLLCKAAVVYAVPADYLVGFVDEAEVAQNIHRQTVLLRHMESQMAAYNNSVRNLMAKSYVEGIPALWMVHDMMNRAAEFSEAWSGFQALNPKAEDMRGGGRLQSTLDALLAICNTASHAMRRHYNLIEKAAELAEDQTSQHRFIFHHCFDHQERVDVGFRPLATGTSEVVRHGRTGSLVEEFA